MADSVHRLEQGWVRPARHLITRLTAVAATGIRHQRAADTAAADGGMADRLAEATQARRRTLAAPVGPFKSAAGRQLAWLADLTVLGIEFFFWYGKWSETVDRRDSLFSLNRLTAVLLALLVPALSVLVAHIGGRLIQRLLVPSSNRSNFTRTGAVAGLGVCVAALIGSVALVYWRFTIPSLIGGPKFPATAMTIVMGTLLVMLVVLHTFAISELDEERRRRDRQVRRDITTNRRLENAVLHANKTWADAWFELALFVDIALNKVERLHASGALIVLDHFARLGRPLPGGSSASVVPAPDKSTTKPGLFPATAATVLPAGYTLGWPLRVIQLSLAALQEYAPPHLIADQRGQLAALRRRHQKLVEAPTHDTTEAGPTVDRTSPLPAPTPMRPEFRLDPEHGTPTSETATRRQASQIRTSDRTS